MNKHVLKGYLVEKGKCLQYLLSEKMLNIKLCNYTQYNLKSHGHGEDGEGDEAAVTNQDVYVENSGATGEEGEGREFGSVSITSKQEKYRLNLHERCETRRRAQRLVEEKMIQESSSLAIIT